MVQGIVTGVYIFHNSVIFIVLVRRFGLACPSSSVLTGTEIEIVVYCTHINPLDTNVKFDACVPTGGPFGPLLVYTVITPILGLKTRPKMCEISIKHQQ